MSKQKWMIDGQKVIFHHIRLTDYESAELTPKGGITRAILVDKDKNTVATAVATCSPNDVYCKAIGRAVSFGRLKKMVEGVKEVFGS